MKIELTEREIELLQRGLSDHISDYVVTEEEEKEYLELNHKLEKLKEENSTIC